LAGAFGARPTPLAKEGEIGLLPAGKSLNAVLAFSQEVIGGLCWWSFAFACITLITFPSSAAQSQPLDPPPGAGTTLVSPCLNISRATSASSAIAATSARLADDHHNLTMHALDADAPVAVALKKELATRSPPR